MKKNKKSEPSTIDYIDQMETDRAHMSKEKWLEFLQEMRDEIKIRIETVENEIEDN